MSSHLKCNAVMNAPVNVAMIAAMIVVMNDVAHSQVSAGLGLGSGIGQIGSGAWLRESRVAPSVRYAHNVGYLRLDASALERAGSLSLERASIDGLASSPALGPLRFALTGQFRDARFDTAQVSSVGSALSARYRATGIWVGTAHDRASVVQYNAGVWAVIRSALISITSRSRATSVYERSRILVMDSIWSDTGATPGWQHYGTFVDREHMSRSRRWSDLETRLDWAGGRVALSAVVTRTSLAAHDSMARSRGLVWGSLNAAVLLNHRVSLVSTIGTLPTGVRADASESRYATLGFRFAPAALLRDPPPAAVRPAASAFRVLPLEPGLYKVVLRAPGARTVELSGDFNQWRPVALTQTAPDIWEVALPLAVGTHRVNVRVNGDRWTAPPGLPSVNDEFSGRVGLLVVR